MVCCFNARVLTRAERDAIARLREQRAHGHKPCATTHRANADRLDPVVTLYPRRHATNHTITANPRFVMKPRAELCDLAEASIDAYFQELMKGDS